MGVPKVAMLFLATKGFAHSAMWAMWFQQAGGLLPADCAAAAVCRAGDPAARAAALGALLRSCGPFPQAPGARPPLSPETSFATCSEVRSLGGCASQRPLEGLAAPRMRVQALLAWYRQPDLPFGALQLNTH